ncbi:MAG: hypothetical protein GF398_09175 [Chitinivibrionales bacterium]|nr:hypothetical protein [Chitinivibrionales bacterium]
MKKLVIIILAVISVGAQSGTHDRLLVSLAQEDPENPVAPKRPRLEELDIDFAGHPHEGQAQAIVTPRMLSRLRTMGYGATILKEEADATYAIPDYFHFPEETFDKLELLHARYPDISVYDTVGFTQREKRPIVRFIISRNAGTREDEPSALFNGMTHAREPLGNEICLYAIEQILEQYLLDDQVTRWVDSMEVHFVPILNVDGYQYMVENASSSPWWRKNLRDNDNNGGDFDRIRDGVDLNRNWDWNWSSGGSTDKTSWTYRGSSGGSEAEIKAMERIVLERKYVVGISYHSYGQKIMRPYSINGKRPPDWPTIENVGAALADAIGGYAKTSLAGYGQSSCWLHGAGGMLDFLAETATEFIPGRNEMESEREKNYNGIKYLLERCFYAGITGHVKDARTGDPLSAEVEVLGLTGDNVDPRTSDRQFGRFFRLLKKGTYSIEVSGSGYLSQTVTGINVVDDSLTYVKVDLVPTSTMLAHRERLTGRSAMEGADVCLFSLNGRTINRPDRRTRATAIAPGVYLYTEAASRKAGMAFVAP